MFCESKWDALIEQFKRDNYLIHSLTTEPLLSINLHTGLAALKTVYVIHRGPPCRTRTEVESDRQLIRVLDRSNESHCSNCSDPATKHPNCPVCQEPFASLAKSLPRAQHSFVRCSHLGSCEITSQWRLITASCSRF